MALELNKNEDETIVDFANTDELKVEDRPVKEYEKLLFQDESRLKGTKALKLVQMGCFYQYKKNTTEINFNDFKKLEGAKSYKDHELYERVSDNTFFYIEAECEETKEGEKKVYRYDIIELDNVDDETFEKLCKAHSHENNGLINFFYYASIVAVVWGFIGIIVQFIYFKVDKEDDFIYAFFGDIASYVLMFAIACAALVCATITKKHHEEK